MWLRPIAVGSMLAIGVALGIGSALALARSQPNPAVLAYLAMGAVYVVGAVGLYRRRRWGTVIAGLSGIIGSLLTLLVLLFITAFVAYYDWRADLNTIGGLPTYPSLAILVAILLANLSIVIASFRVRE
jgi:hypothetical protein